MCTEYVTDAAPFIRVVWVDVKTPVELVELQVMVPVGLLPAMLTVKVTICPALADWDDVIDVVVEDGFIIIVACPLLAVLNESPP